MNTSTITFHDQSSGKFKIAVNDITKIKIRDRDLERNIIAIISFGGIIGMSVFFLSMRNFEIF